MRKGGKEGRGVKKGRKTKREKKEGGGKEIN